MINWILSKLTPQDPNLLTEKRVPLRDKILSSISVKYPNSISIEEITAETLAGPDRVIKEVMLLIESNKLVVDRNTKEDELYLSTPNPLERR